ncbi:MAG: UDP-N-acetylmuramoyl-tripeptide-D-alanyl-D-alanine ligase [Parcubacteria group bacterium GW2011_GWC1_43_12]|nr:MAG: UDP-N-acetylmuramoyl-tripeptide-D-alanyl-D-alanine ligase [Parcubacteria group bacterium GW2011_GWC1_43_12]
MLKIFLAYLLKILAQLTLSRYKPFIIAITGSVGKTSAKEAVYSVLKNRFSVRRNRKNYNNEIGVPLTIIDAETGGCSIFAWFKIFAKGITGVFYAKNYPKVLVLEMGADKIGDIRYLADFVPVDIGIITTIGEIPVHVEFFRTPEQVAKEKSNLIANISQKGWAVLNFDDLKVRNMNRLTKANVMTYGFGEGADVAIRNLKISLEQPEDAHASFEIKYKDKSASFAVKNVLGKHQICPILAAICAGLIMDMDLTEISFSFKDYKSLAGRMNLIKGVKNSLIIDDSYNSSPSSTLAALDVLESIPGKRKIAAIGDMLELGLYTEEAHRNIAAKAAKISDFFFAVGERAIFMVDQAKKSGMDENKIFYFASSDEAGKKIQEIVNEDDVILVKGSQGVRMEKISKELMAEPQKAGELLVRQEEGWK